MKYSLPIALAMLAGTTDFVLAESHEPLDQVAVVEQALAGGDPEAGERVFRKCKACHEVGPGAEAKVGPPLNGVVGSVLGQTDGFNYSNTMVEMSGAGTAWTVENLDVYLTRPRDFIDRTRMTFAGLRRDEERANIIAYLATLTDDVE